MMKKILIFLICAILGINAQCQLIPGVIASSVQASGSGNPLLDGLVGYFDFNESSGTLDNKVGSNNGTAGAGITYSQTSLNVGLGTCLQFSGTSTGYVSLPDVLDFQFGTSDFTIGCWFYTTSYSQQGIFGGENEAVALDIVALSFFLGNVNVNAYYFTLSTTINTWNFIAISFDSHSTTNNATLYLNGTTQTITANFDASAGASMNLIGQDSPGALPFTGYIDEVFIYKDRNLTSSELDILHNNGNGLAYPFN